MAHKTKNIIIFGATGLIGEHITNAIVSNKADFGRLAIFTSQNTLQSKSDAIDKLKSQGVEVITGDLTSKSDINEALKGFDTVVSAVGRPVIHTQIQIVELMDKHPDVKRFFPSEYGTDIEYDETSKDEKPHQQKLKVRAALKQVKDLEYTYVVTGPYGDADKGLYLSAAPPDDDDKRASFDVKRKRALLLGDGEGKISLTTMRDVGKLVVAAIKHPDASKNKALKVNSFTTTPKEIVAEFEKQTGDSWDISYTSLDELKKLEQEAWDRGDPGAGPMTLRRIWTSGRTLYDHRDNDAIEMEDGVESLESAVKQAIKVQTA